MPNDTFLPRKSVSAKIVASAIGRFIGGSAFLALDQLILGVSTETLGKWYNEANSSILRMSTASEVKKRLWYSSNIWEPVFSGLECTKPLRFAVVNCLK